MLRKFFISSILYIYYIKNFLKSQIFEKFSFWSLVCPSHLLSSVFPLCHSESIAQGDNSESISYGDPTGTRTRICTLKGCCPRPVRRWGDKTRQTNKTYPMFLIKVLLFICLKCKVIESFASLLYIPFSASHIPVICRSGRW